MSDDFGFGDDLQDEVNRAVDSIVPFEPDAEFRADPVHEQAEEADAKDEDHKTCCALEELEFDLGFEPDLADEFGGEF